MTPHNLIIRDCTPDDVPTLLAIYSHYIENTAVTFEYDTPSIEEFRQRIDTIQAQYPYLVAELNGHIVGYIYASVFNTRRAARFTATTSIYIAEGHHGMGIGKTLYSALEERLAKQGIINLIATITWVDTPNSHLTHNSPLFHQKIGFTKVGHLHRVGYKFGEWYDLLYMEKQLDIKYFQASQTDASVQTF